MPISVETDPADGLVRLDYQGAIHVDDTDALPAVLEKLHGPQARVALLIDYTDCRDWPEEIFAGIGWHGLRAGLKFLRAAAFVDLERFPVQARMIEELLAARGVPYRFAATRTEAERFLSGGSPQG
jgi:hypothetical protein